MGLHFPLSWIEDVRVVVPDAENETLSSLQILLNAVATTLTLGADDTDAQRNVS